MDFLRPVDTSGVRSAIICEASVQKLRLRTPSDLPLLGPADASDLNFIRSLTSQCCPVIYAPSIALHFPFIQIVRLARRVYHVSARIYSLVVRYNSFCSLASFILNWADSNKNLSKLSLTIVPIVHESPLSTKCLKHLRTRYVQQRKTC